MKDFFEKQKVKAALKRAGRTVCQTAVGLIGTSLVITDVDWALVVSASALAGVVSLLTSAGTELPEAPSDYNIGA